MKIGRTTSLLAFLHSKTLAQALALAVPAALPLGVVALVGSSLVGCADENDPNTWVKRLDDPAQRAAAIKRLGAFYDDGISKANKNREAPEMKTLADSIVPPLTKTYVSVTLDEKTRKDLMKLLGDTRDPRTAPALAKAFNEYEPGINDEDVKYAAQSVIGQAAAGATLDPSVVDALWSCFSKFHASNSKSINLVHDLHDAVLAVKSPSYGPKAVEKLAAPVDPTVPAQSLDQIQFWQQTSIQILSDLKFAPGAKALVTVVMSPTKSDLRATANAAILQIPQAAEPFLIAGLKGTDPDLAKQAALFEDKSYVAVVGDSLSWLSRPAGRAAILDVLASTDSDQNRYALAQSLVHFPPDAVITKAFIDAYAKIPPTASFPAFRVSNARSALAGASVMLYQPAVADWLVKEIATAKGDTADEIKLSAADAAINLMQPAQQPKVEAFINKEGAPREKTLFKLASDVMSKCHENAMCYAGVVAEPVASSPKEAAETQAKAAWMAVAYGAGNAQVRNALVDKLASVKDPSARQAAVEAIDALAPAGDPGAAEKLEKIVATDKATSDKNLMMGDDAVVKVAAKLRSRALP